MHFTSTFGVLAGKGQYCATAEAVARHAMTEHAAMVRITLTYLSPSDQTAANRRPWFLSNLIGLSQRCLSLIILTLVKRRHATKKRAGLLRPALASAMVW